MWLQMFLYCCNSISWFMKWYITMSAISLSTITAIFIVKLDSDSWFLTLFMLQSQTRKCSQILSGRGLECGISNKQATLLTCWSRFPVLFTITWPKVFGIIRLSVVYSFYTTLFLQRVFLFGNDHKDRKESNLWYIRILHVAFHSVS